VAARHPESLGAAAFRALVRHDTGGSTVALSELLASVAATSGDPDVVRYRRALTAYAAELRDRG
jgi:cyanophycin synthetase